MISTKLFEIALLPEGGFNLEYQGQAAIDLPALKNHPWVTTFTDSPGELFFQWASLPEAEADSLSPSARFFRSIAFHFVHTLLLHPQVETLRHRTVLILADKNARRYAETAPPMLGGDDFRPEHAHAVWMLLHEAFKTRVRKSTIPVEAIMGGEAGTLSTEAVADEHGANAAIPSIGHLHFHLVESPKEEMPFAFLATYGRKTGAVKWAHVPLRVALREEATSLREKVAVLQALKRGAEQSKWLSEKLDAGLIFHPLSLTADEAYGFLQEVETLQAQGILCRVPNWWQDAKKPLRAQIKLGESEAAGMGLDALLDFKLSLAYDGIELSASEIKALAESGESLALIKGRWVSVDSAILKQSLELLEKAKKLAKKSGLTLRDAMRILAMGGSPKALGLPEEAQVDWVPGDWLKQILEKLQSAASGPKKITASPHLKATLRTYQKTGLHWLKCHNELGFGACLADDMGLGKTVQVIALLQARKDEIFTAPTLNALLIVPASLIFNWIQELQRFAPGLTFTVVHGTMGERATKAPLDAQGNLQVDIILTTYAMTTRTDWLGKHDFDLCILDEAQNIKSPGTAQTLAVKKVKAKWRLAMTGTPVENRLADLWSIFDFLNPGMLGSQDAFAKQVKNMQTGPEGLAPLRRMLSPFILRRCKTDKSLLPDLPDKVEVKRFVTLSKTQAALYQRQVEQLASKLENLKGFERQGLVFAYMSKLKQICNHPDHFSGNKAYRESESGKFTALRELCEPIAEKRERILVFTQFAEIADPLADFLAEVFGAKGQILTGKTPIAQRKKIVERFQAESWTPFMVISVKAGGVGLNLTRASHVIHFDRWWNPAVENQATDRAFRLGQTKNVMVHPFVTRGTLEEKIDAMLERKRGLAAGLLGDGSENWITQMSNSEIMSLFALETA